MKHLFHTIVFWLTCDHKQPNDYVFVQTLELFPQSFISRTGWNCQKFRMMNTRKLSKCSNHFQSFSHKCRNLTKHRKTSRDKISNELLNCFHWKGWFGSEEWRFCHPKKGYNSRKYLLLPSLIICLDMELFLHRSCYCIHRELKCQISYKAGTSQVSTFGKPRVSSWFA